MEQQADHAPVTLHNGRVVVFSREPSGSQKAEMQDGAAMTDAEWEMLCAAIRPQPQGAA